MPTSAFDGEMRREGSCTGIKSSPEYQWGVAGGQKHDLSSVAQLRKWLLE